MSIHEHFDPATYPHKLTTADVCLGTFNAVLIKILKVASTEEQEAIGSLLAHIQRLQSDMDAYQKKQGHFRSEDQKQLCLLMQDRDALIVQLQQKYKIKVPMSRSEVNVTPIDGFGGSSVGVANMMRSTGRRMGEGSAQMGSWAVYPQGKSKRNVEDFVTYVQSRHPRYQTPVEVLPYHMVRDALYYLQKRPLDHVVITDERRTILGVLNRAELEEAALLDDEMEVDSLLTDDNRKVITAPEGVKLQEAIDMMKSEKIHFLPVTSKRAKSRQKLRWVLTRDGAEQRMEVAPNLDEKKRLATVLAISAQRDGWQERVDHALGLEVTALVLDSPRFDLGYEEWLERVRYAAEKIVATGRPVRLIVGNVDEPSIVEGIIAQAKKSGMDSNMVVVKVGIGPGAACTTRVMSGIGEPQWSTVQACATAARRLGGHVYADGGIREPGDLVKLIAAGATQGVIGTIAVPLIESPATLYRDENGVYAVNFGMASEVFAQLREDVKQNKEKSRRGGGFVEGLGKQIVYQQKGIHTIADLINRIRNGMKGGGAMVGAFNMSEFYEFSHVALQHNSGFLEGLGKAVVK